MSLICTPLTPVISSWRKSPIVENALPKFRRVSLLHVVNTEWTKSKTGPHLQKLSMLLFYWIMLWAPLISHVPLKSSVLVHLSINWYNYFHFCTIECNFCARKYWALSLINDGRTWTWQPNILLISVHEYFLFNHCFSICNPIEAPLLVHFCILSFGNFPHLKQLIPFEVTLTPWTQT